MLACMIERLRCLMLLRSDQPIPLNPYFLADELALIPVESGLVAVERDGLVARETMDHHIDLSDGGAALTLSIAAENIALGLRDVSHG